MRYELHISKSKPVDARLKSSENIKKLELELELERYLDLGTGAGTLEVVASIQLNLDNKFSATSALAPHGCTCQ